MEKQEQKKSIVLGIIGAIIGAMIATIPWVLMYVYGEMILSLLAILIAMGALMGYQLFKGKITKQLPIIISIISLIMVVVATLVVIPLLLLGKENLPMTWNNVEILYQSTEFKNALFKDLAISVAFTILGISGVIANIKKQLADGKTDKISATLRKEKDTADTNSENNIESNENK